jgi:phage gp29-like protein
MSETILYDHRGNKIQSAQLGKELAAPTLSGIRSIWDESVTGGLTPYRLAALLQGAAEGDANDYLALAEEMEERDLHYRCEMSKRRLAVASLPVVVESASDDDKDVMLAGEVRAMVKKAGFRGLLKDLLDAIGKGYSVSEIMWDRGAKWIPRGYEWRDQRFFLFDRESRRKIRLIDAENVSEGIELEGYKFLVHLPHLKTGIPIRGGLARVAAWAYLCKNYTLKDWLAFAEVFGMPLRLGKYQNGAQPEDINVLKMAVANLGSDAAAVIPDSMRIEFVEAAKSTGGDTLFMRLADWLDAQVSRGILGQTATTVGTPGKLGGDDAQAEVREDIRDDDATQLAETINRDLIIPFIDLNFGPQENYPELILRSVENDDLQVFTNALKELVPLGLKVEQSVVRDKLNIPDPADNAELLGAPVQKTTPPPKIAENSSKKSLNRAEDEQGSDIENALYDWMKEQSEASAVNMIDQAEALLGKAKNLEEFREQLIDLFTTSNPEQLAIALARLDLLATLAGRLEAKEEE